MKRLITAFLAYIALFVGSSSVVLALMSLDVSMGGGGADFLYFFGGMAVISFVISWLLMKISRKK